MPTEIHNDVREVFPVARGTDDGGTSTPDDADELRVLYKKWDKLVDAIVTADTEPEWWDEVTSAFPMLLHTRSKILEKIDGRTEPVRQMVATDADWVSDDETAEAVDMWTHAVRLIDYTVDELRGELDADRDMPPGDLETHLPLLNKLLWAATLRDVFTDIIHRHFEGGASDSHLPDVVRWSMTGLYLMAKQGFHVLRDLGFDLPEPPEEERLTELDRIHAVFDLAERVDRPLDERVGTFERPVPGYDHLVRRWDKPYDEPYIERYGVRAKIVAHEVDAGESPEDVATNRDLPPESVDQAVRFFGR